MVLKNVPLTCLFEKWPPPGLLGPSGSGCPSVL